MSYESGNITTRVFHVPKPLPQDAIARFAANALPPLESLADGTIHGFVTGRHMLDRNITDDAATYGGYLRLALVQAERKVPAKLLRAEIRMEELARMQASGVDRLPGSVRREIARSVEARLQPSAQPTLKEIPFVYDPRAETIYAGAMSNKQQDALQIQFAQAIGFSLLPMIPEMAASKLCSSNVRDWNAASFSPDVHDSDVTNDAGMDFLTWLWFIAEARGGMMKIENIGDVAVMIEGPLQFHMEGAGAHDVAIRKGEPLLSASAKTALMSGMKPCRAKVTLAKGNDAYTFTLDAPSFGIRGLKLPDVEKDATGKPIKFDAVSRFQSRMDSLETFRAMFYGMFQKYVFARISDGYRMDIQEMRQWVKDRKVRT